MAICCATPTDTAAAGEPSLPASDAFLIRYCVGIESAESDASVRMFQTNPWRAGMKWPSWLNVLFGVWLIFAPFWIGYDVRTAVVEDITLGIAVMFVGLWSAGAINSVAAWINLMLGFWIVTAPWAMGYAGLAGGAAANDIVIGLLVMFFAAVRIVSDSRMPTVGGPSPR
jgi:hypothetical protein